MNAKISTYFVGVVMFTFFIVAGISMIAIFNESDSTFIDTAKYNSFNQSVNKYQDVTESLGDIQESVTGAEGGNELADLIKVAWNTLKSLPTLFSFMTSAYFGLATFFGVPLWIPSLLAGIVIIIIIFAIWSAIFQNDI